MRLYLAALLLLLALPSSWSQNGKDSDPIAIDLFWVAAVEQNQGWLITSAPPGSLIPTSKRNLKTGDLLLKIEGHSLAELGPLAVVRLLIEVPFRDVPIELLRHGTVCDVEAFGEVGLTDGTTNSAPTYSPTELQKHGEPAPQFSLPDLEGQRHELNSYRGKWVLLNLWGTWCSGCIPEIPALNELDANYRARITVVSVAMNDSPATLKRFVAQHEISYPVLLGGTFEEAFSRSYNVHTAPTNVVISPEGEVRFVGVGPMSLKGSVETVARAQRTSATSN